MLPYSWDKNKLPSLAEFIEYSENFSATIYPCTSGKDTIGIGRNLDDNPLTTAEKQYLIITHKLGSQGVDAYLQKGISRDDALFLLDNDLMKCKEALAKVMPKYDQLPRHVQYVLIDIIFNTGITAFKGFKKLQAALERYRVSKVPLDLNEAAVELLHCGKGGYLFDVKTRAVRNARLLADDWASVLKTLASRPGTKDHIAMIHQYGGLR